MKSLTIDEIYNIIGNLGYAQILYTISLGSLQILISHHMLLNIYTGLEPTFLCFSKNESLFKYNNKNYIVQTCFNKTQTNCNLKYKDTFTSIVTEWDLVCDQKYKVALVQSIWMGGVMCGALFLGSVADRIGRIKTLMISLIGIVAFEGLSSFVVSYNLYIILRFLGGMSCAVVILASFVLGQELVGSCKRSLCGIGTGIFFSLAIVYLSFLASHISSWRNLTLMTSVFGLIFLYIPFFVPESPRWLCSQGRIDEAREVLENMAKKNGTIDSLPPHWDLVSTEKKNSNKSSESIKELFSNSYLLTLTLIQIYSWFVNSSVYYALTMAAGSVGGNIYVATSLNGLVEIPANWASIVIIDRYGRRIGICSYMLFGGTMCMLVPVVATYYPSLVNVVALLGKMGISGSFGVIYIHSGEIFPTVLRNTALGVVSVAARVGGIASPFIIMLGDLQPYLHFVFLGSLTFVAGLLNMKLPETLGKPTPETIDDMLLLRSAQKAKVDRGKDYSSLSQEEKINFDSYEEEEVTVFSQSDVIPLIHSKN